MRTWQKYVVIVAVVVWSVVAWNVSRRFQPSGRDVSFTQFLHDVDAGRIETISIRGDEVAGVNTQTGHFRTYAPRGYVGFVNTLIARDVDVSVVPEGLWSGACAPWVLMLVMTHVAGLALLRRQSASCHA
jgi:cell division protease FtsH